MAPPGGIYFIWLGRLVGGLTRHWLARPQGRELSTEPLVQEEVVKPGFGCARGTPPAAAT